MAEIFDLEELGTAACAEALADALLSGGLAVFPTDTVYGLAASAQSAPALQRIFSLKGRETEKSLVVMVPGLEEALEMAAPKAAPALRRLARFWPGGLTVVAPRRGGLSWAELVAPGKSTLGLRIPDHPLALSLLEAAGALAVTSANLSGGAAPRRFEEVPPLLLESVRAACRSRKPTPGLPSTIVEITPASLDLLREGPIPYEELLRAWKGET